MMSDAPAHHLFCLLGPVDPNSKSLPEVLVVIQVRVIFFHNFHMKFFFFFGPVNFIGNLNVFFLNLQVCLEGQISRESASDGLSRGKRASGDLIPWTVAQQFQDPDFPMLSGARIVRIATHPDYQGVSVIFFLHYILYLHYPCLWYVIHVFCSVRWDMEVER